MTDYRSVLALRNRGQFRGANPLERVGLVRQPQIATLPAVCPGHSYQHYSPSRSFAMHFQYEALARERMLEQRANAAHQRLTDELVAARRWQRLAAFTATRAARSQRRLAQRSMADSSLTG
jgi:hypothetical protein